MGRNKAQKGVAASRRELPVNKLKRDPGVPKLSLRHKQLQKIADRRSETARQGHAAGDGDMALDSPQPQGTPSQTIAGLAAAVNLSATNLLESSLSDSAIAQNAINDPTMVAHAHQFKKVLDLADVILQVLDARDPLGCRSKIVEEEVAFAGGNKKIILILNKTDLVPKENVLAWLRYLRHDYPTIPFKSSTQLQKSHLSSSSSSKAGSKGTPHLLHLLKSIRPAHQSITVGVLGPPNVGKSSLINSIKREKVCTVGAKPGETKALKEVVVERGIRVIDSPGIVWGATEEEGSALRNVWSLEGVEEPTRAVESIVSRVPHNTLQQMYNLPQFRDASEFLVMIALARGKLGKGGKPDLSAAALMVLHDWNIGKIPYFSTPPAIHPSQMTSVVPQPAAMSRNTQLGPVFEEDPITPDPYASTSIVTSWSKPFDLDGLWKAADEDVLGSTDGDGEMRDTEDAAGAGVEGFLPDADDQMDDDADVMQSDDLDPVIPSKRARSNSLTSVGPGISSRLREGPKKHVKYTPSDPAEIAQLSTMNPLSRKRLREDAKKRKKRAGSSKRAETISGVGIDVDALMGPDIDG